MQFLATCVFLLTIGLSLYSASSSWATPIQIQKGIALVGGTLNQQFSLDNHAHAQRYLIQVFAPNIRPPQQGFPVIYMLDGNASFPYASILAQSMLSRAAQTHTVPPVIVAIGYTGDKTINIAARSYDYTPPFKGPFIPHPARPTPAYPQGGAEIFFQFIETQLKPVIAEHYAINTQQQSLFGHSYGGLFTLYTLLNHPEAFQFYMAASPSIWWNDEMILKQAINTTNTALSQPTRLWLSVGSNESVSKTAPTSPDDTDIERFARAVKTRPNLEVTTFHIADASHFEALFAAINLLFRPVPSGS